MPASPSDLVAVIVASSAAIVAILREWRRGRYRAVRRKRTERKRTRQLPPPRESA